MDLLIGHWPSFWIGVAAVPVTAIIVAVVLAVFLRATDKNIGAGGCLVCDEAFVCDTGDYTRLGIWLRSRRHNWFIRNRKWHRDAWARHRWNPYRLPGYPEDEGQAASRRPKPNILVRVFWAIVG